MRALITTAQRPEHIARLERRARARGAARKRHILKRHEQRLALDVCERHVHTTGVVALRVAVLARVFETQQTIEQPLRQRRDAFRVVRHFLLRDAARLPEPDHQRRRQRAGPQPALLPAAADDGVQAHARPPPHEARAHPLRPVDLVARDAHQVDVPRIHVDGDLADGLRGVGVEEGLFRAAQRADLGHRLDHADFVVDCHYAYQGRVGADGGFEVGERDESVRLHGEVGHFEALFLQVARGVEHALVFRLGGDDVAFFPRPAEEARDAFEGHVV